MNINVDIIINGELSVRTLLNDSEIQELIMYVNKLNDIHKNIIQDEESE
jgi:hypothetical protein